MVRNELEKYGDEFIANVIRIIDERTLLVNAGTNELEPGQIIQVYEIGPEIKDIDGRVLDRYFFVKDELEVIRVENSYSVCQKQKTITKTYSPFALSPLLETHETEYVPLNIDKADIESLKPTEPLIKIGDPIKLA